MLTIDRYCFPIVGGRKVDHLKGNIEALSVELSNEDIKEIDDAEPFDVGFPLNFLFGPNYRSDMTTSDIQLVNTNWRIDTVPPVKVSLVLRQGPIGREYADGIQPIEPAQGKKKFEAKGE